MRERRLKKTLAFIVMIAMVFTMAYTPLGAAYAATETTWTALTNIDAAAESEKPVAITMTKSDNSIFALPAAETSSSPAAKFAEIQDGKLVTSGEETVFGWTVTKTGTGDSATYTFENSEGKFLYLTAANAGVRVGNKPATGGDWKITDAYLSAVDSNNATRYLGVYNTQDWRCYALTNTGAFPTNIKDQTLRFWEYEGDQQGEEIQIVPISQALAASYGDFKVKGVVTMVDGRNIYVQDDTGGICMYFAEAPEDIELGDTIIADGSRETYRGLPELSNGEYTKVEADADKIELKAAAKKIADLTAADVCTYVTIKDLTVTEVYDNNGAYTAPNITVADADGKTIQIYRAIDGKTDGAWDIAVNDEVDVTAAVGINNSTLQLRNTKASEIAFTEPYVEPETSTIAEALAGDTNAQFTVKGVITMVDGRNIYIQDATGGICMFFDAAPEDLKLGDTIIADGVRATYRGLPELSSSTYTKVDKASAQIKLQPAEKKIADLTTADVCTYVTIKDLTVTEVYDNNGAYTTPNITVADTDGKTIQIYRAIVGKTDGAWDVAVGDTVDVTAAVGINNSTLQLRNTDAPEIAKSGSDPVDPAGDSFGLVSRIETGDEVILYNAAGKMGVGNTVASNKITGIGLTEKDGVITTDNEAAVWTAAVNTDGTYTFTQSEMTLGGVVSGTYNNLVPTGATFTNWTLTGPDEGDFSYFLNLDDMQSSFGKVYLEYYNGFTLYGSNAPTKAAYGIQFFKKGAEPETPDTPDPGEAGDLITDLSQLNDGDTIAIYSPGHKTAISSKPNGDWYLKAEPATIKDGKVEVFTDYLIWTVKKNNDGTYSFTAYNDENHSITVWPSGNYAELTVNTNYEGGDNKWTVAPAAQANCFNISSPNVSGSRGPAFIEAYVRNGTEVFSGYFTNNYSGADFAMQFYRVDPEDAVDSYDDGEWDGVLTSGDEYVIYNTDKELSLGLYKAANYAFDAIPTIIDEDNMAVPGNGAYVFKVGSMGRYYTFEVNGEYLSTNNDEELFFIAPDENGKIPDTAKWYLTPTSGTTEDGNAVSGYLIYNKEAQYGGTPVTIEYFSSVFSGWTFNTRNDLGIYVFNFHKVAEGTQVHDGVVQVPSAEFDCENYRYVEQDFPVTISLDDLCPDIGNAEITYTVENAESTRTETITDYETSSDEKNYTFTIPAADIDGDTPPGSFEIRIAVTNGFGISYESSKLIDVIDLPFFEDLTPPPASQTGDDLKPVISARVRNAGTDPTVTMTINDEEITNFTFEDGVISYKPDEDLAKGKTTVQISASRTDGKEANDTWSFTAGKAEYELYFGQLHSHTTYSDGSGTLETALDYISSLPESANVQFVAFTDHSNYFDTTSAANPADALNDKEQMTPASKALWEGYKEKVAAFNAKQKDVVAIAGFEMTWSGGPGHINTFDSDGLVSRNNAELNNKTNDAGMKFYYETINEGDSMNQFNHPGATFGNFTDFSYWDEETDDHMFLVEVGNGEGLIGAGGYYPSYEQYIMALDKGWHVAPTNNQDNHKGRWGNANDARDVVLTNDFSEEGIYNAIRAMRIYATEDKNLQITYTVNGKQMGTIFEEAPEKLNIDITNYDPDNNDPTDKVELVANGGKVVKTWDSSSDPDAINKGTFTAEIDPDDSYYFVRITQADNDIAVTAPVWVGKGINAGISDVAAPASAIVDTDTTLTTSFFNNEESAAAVKSITYTADGSKVIGTDNEEHAVPAGGTIEVPFTFKPDTAKRITITVTAVMEIGGSEMTYTKDVILSVRDNEGPLPVSPISEVQAQTEEGFEYAIEGVVTSNASGYDKDTAFFDCVYVQDETAGICCFPVSGEYKIGDKVHIEGYTDFYQGEAELQVRTIEVIGEGSIEPIEVTAKQIKDQSVLGSLVTLKGTVESFEVENGLIQTIMVKDADGDVARVFIDGYITTGNEVAGCEVGAEISATGLASYDDTFNAPEGPFPRIRIRNRADIVCGSSAPSDIESVIEAVDALPEEVTADDEAAIADARSMYDALSEDDKAAVPDETKLRLEVAEARLIAAKAEAAAAAAQTDKEKAEADAAAAQTDKEKAEAAAAAAQTDKEKAEADAAAAQTDKEKAEAAAAAAKADKDKADAAAETAKADKSKAEAETAAAKADKDKADAETAAAKADKDKAEAETAAGKADKDKAEAETAAAQADKSKAEAAAAAAEAARKAAEDLANGSAAEAERAKAALALASAVVDAVGVDTGKYQTSTVDKFKKALSAAKKALRNSDATTAELNEANAGLAKASDGLVLKVRNPMTVKAKSVRIKASRLKRKTVTVTRKKVFTIKKRRGKVTYKKVSGNKKITINKKTGKVTVKKGLKKGTYKVKVKVTASGTGKYKKTTKTRTFRIIVK